MKIKERSVRGKKARALSGKIHGSGHELYGYRRDKERGVRVVFEPEAQIVSEIFESAVKGVPLRTLARSLNSRCIPSPSTGKVAYADGRTPRWGKGTLTRILRNPEYKGEAVAWKYQHKTNTNIGQYRPADEWIPLPEGTTPPLVSAGLWERAQDKLSANRGEATRNERAPYLLRGHIFCSVCGARLYTCPERGRRTYRCSSRERPTGACGAKRVPAEHVEGKVWEAVAGILAEPQLIADEIQRRRTEGPDATLVADLQAARNALQRVTRQQERLVRKFREADDDSFPWELIEREITVAESEKRQLLESIDSLEARIAQQETAVQHLESMAEYMATVRGNLSELTFETKRLALEALDIEIRASGTDPAAWTLRGSIPVDAGVLAQSYSHTGRNAHAISFSLPLAP